MFKFGAEQIQIICTPHICDLQHLDCRLGRNQLRSSFMTFVYLMAAKHMPMHNLRCTSWSEWFLKEMKWLEGRNQESMQ